MNFNASQRRNVRLIVSWADNRAGQHRQQSRQAGRCWVGSGMSLQDEAGSGAVRRERQIPEVRIGVRHGPAEPIWRGRRFIVILGKSGCGWVRQAGFFLEWTVRPIGSVFGWVWCVR